ncbi:MAG: isoprenylcysteine carboxylmethyltransferase family protein [Planctomycetes bacterium]|nr:isoprenylcysteine carboxylmethyltransferase family protein [Planctomycetota bacterium]
MLTRSLAATVVLPGTVALLVPAFLWYSPLRLLIDLGVARWAGVALLGAGALLYGWTTLDFARRGHGTPAPWDPPQKLVVSGLYRFSRNPMYVGVLSWILGAGLLLQSAGLLGYAALVGIGFHLRVVLFEEPMLQKEFGQEFADYRRTVRRWI